MRVLAIFALAQIVGVLGGRIASKRDLTRDGESRIIESFQDFLNYADFNTFVDVTPNFETSGRIKCEINGGPGAHNAVSRSMQNLIKSLTVLTNETRIQVDTAATSPHGRLDLVVEKVCQWVTTADILIIAHTETLKRCLSPEERTSIDQINNIFTAGLQHVCQNKGSRISAFFAADGMNCVNSAFIESQNCRMTSFHSETSVFSQPSEPSSQFPILSLNTQVCTEFQAYQQCLIGVYQRCENPTPAYEINSLFNILKKTSGCEDMLKANIISTPNNSK